MTRFLGKFAAVVVLVACALALAVSQGLVIVEACQANHAAWNLRMCYVMAFGFEGSILAVTLAMALTGYSWPLVVSEVVLISMSLMAGSDVTVYGVSLHNVALKAMPIQYAIVIAAAHTLARHFGKPVTRKAGMLDALGSTLLARLGGDMPEPVTVPSTPKRTRRRQPQLTNAERYAALASQHGDKAWSEIAAAADKSERTVKRWRAQARDAGLLVT